MAYKKFKSFFRVGVTLETVTQKEGEFLNQPPDRATGDERNYGGNIANQSQLLGVS